MASRGNIAKRGSTWTYYVYVTDGDGSRRQVSKGGFRTRKQAEAARIEALATINNGTWVEPGRLTVREFLEDEWLPSQRPPTLEESTYRSYQRNIRLHVVPNIGGRALQQLTPMDLNKLYRKLLDSGRRQGPTRGRAHRDEVLDLIDELRADGTDVADDRRSSRRDLRRGDGHHPPRGRCDAPTSPPPAGAEADAGRAVTEDGALRPLDPPRGVPRRHALEPDTSQHRRRGDAAAGAVDEAGQEDDLDRRAAQRLPPVRRREPLPDAVAVPRHDRVPAGRVPRAQVVGPRPRRRPRR